MISFLCVRTLVNFRICSNMHADTCGTSSTRSSWTACICRPCLTKCTLAAFNHTERQCAELLACLSVNGTTNFRTFQAIFEIKEEPQTHRGRGNSLALRECATRKVKLGLGGFPNRKSKRRSAPGKAGTAALALALADRRWRWCNSWPVRHCQLFGANSLWETPGKVNLGFWGITTINSPGLANQFVRCDQRKK